MTPRLETHRLVLRQFATGDWDTVRAILSHPESTRFMHFATLTEDQRRQWFDTCVTDAQHPDPNPFFWAITLKETGNLIGWLGLERSIDPATPGEHSIGYLLHRPYWNQGYMTETLRSVIADQFGTRGALRLQATCSVDNPASARVMEKAGMRHEKTVVGDSSEGRPEQRHHYAITKANYESRQA